MKTTSVAGIIFANSNDQTLPKLTEKRSMASVPFGGRYRLIDFSISNFVNAGITNMTVITKENYRSLMDHIGSGANFDLDRKHGGIRLLPPFDHSKNGRYDGYIEALKGAEDFIKRSRADYIVISDGDFIANVDISSALEQHVEKGADITVVYKNGEKPKNHKDTMVLSLGNDEKIESIVFSETQGDVNFGMELIIINREVLLESVDKAYNNEGRSINRDILAKKVSCLNIYGFKHEGFVAFMDSEESFYKANMALLNKDVRKDLFNRKRPIFTKTRDDMPTRYGLNSDVKNSIIGEGCIIEGTVKNSIVFRGVKVEKGATVEDCILMQGTLVSAGAKLSNVIADKNAVICSDMVLKGTKEKKVTIMKNQTL